MKGRRLPFFVLKKLNMIRTKTKNDLVNAIPDTWIFEHYLSIPKLTGQDVVMKSLWNSQDKNPSFKIFYKDDKYLFKDFSVGKGGDGVQLVRLLYNLNSRDSAIRKVLKDYKEFTKAGGKHEVQEIISVSRFKVKSFNLRNWTASDAAYWVQFNINSNILNHFNVNPLSSYTLWREDTKEEINIVGSRIYGYFRNDGTVYKIYQPDNNKYKFFKAADYIQGVDQLTFEKDYLVICSSMKDLLTFNNLGFKNAECIAPDSENTMIPKHVILKLQGTYKAVCTLFDNDEAGVRSMQKYKDAYGLSGVHLKLEKDLADSVKAHGVVNTRIHLYPILTKALTGKSKYLT